MDNKIPTEGKKPRQKANNAKIRKPKPPTQDVFTAICKAELHVDCVKEYRFHDKRMWRFDYAIPDHKIALEVEGGIWTGGRHTSAKGFLGDMEKYNQATLMGWRVLRCVPETLLTRQTISMIASAIANS